MNLAGALQLSGWVHTRRQTAHQLVPRHSGHHRHAKQLQQPCAGGGGLFGGLQDMFNNPQKQQQKQAAGQQQQQQQQQTAGTTAKPEFPPYQVVKKGGAYDLRLYQVYPVVEMDYERRETAYLALGSYQDGSANASGTRFGFTQPVVMQYHPDGRKVMQMMVGSRRDGSISSSADITSLPAPTDPAVRLGVAGGELVAVLYFDGYITPDSAQAARQKLIKALQADGMTLAPEEAEGYFRCAQYGAVYTLETRVNEMLLKVQV